MTDRNRHPRGKWQRELIGWDDGDVYVYHQERGNFSVKKHPALHHKLVALAVQYFEEHNVQSEDELAKTRGRAKVSKYMSYLLRQRFSFSRSIAHAKV